MSLRLALIRSNETAGTAQLSDGAQSTKTKQKRGAPSTADRKSRKSKKPRMSGGHAGSNVLEKGQKVGMVIASKEPSNTSNTVTSSGEPIDDVDVELAAWIMKNCLNKRNMLIDYNGTSYKAQVKAINKKKETLKILYTGKQKCTEDLTYANFHQRLLHWFCEKGKQIERTHVPGIVTDHTHEAADSNNSLSKSSESGSERIRKGRLDKHKTDNVSADLPVSKQALRKLGRPKREAVTAKQKGLKISTMEKQKLKLQQRSSQPVPVVEKEEDKKDDKKNPELQPAIKHDGPSDRKYHPLGSKTKKALSQSASTTSTAKGSGSVNFQRSRDRAPLSTRTQQKPIIYTYVSPTCPTISDAPSPRDVGFAVQLSRLAKLLLLPAKAILTAMSFYHRAVQYENLYPGSKLKQYIPDESGVLRVTCVFLAAKVSDNSRSLRDVLTTGERVLTLSPSDLSLPPRNDWLDLDKKYWKKKKEIVECEQLLINAFGFHVDVLNTMHILVHLFEAFCLPEQDRDWRYMAAQIVFDFYLSPWIVLKTTPSTQCLIAIRLAGLKLSRDPSILVKIREKMYEEEELDPDMVGHVIREYLKIYGVILHKLGRKVDSDRSYLESQKTKLSEIGNDFCPALLACSSSPTGIDSRPNNLLNSDDSTWPPGAPRAPSLKTAGASGPRDPQAGSEHTQTIHPQPDVLYRDTDFRTRNTEEIHFPHSKPSQPLGWQIDAPHSSAPRLAVPLTAQPPMLPTPEPKWVNARPCGWGENTSPVPAPSYSETFSQRPSGDSRHSWRSGRGPPCWQSAPLHKLAECRRDHINRLFQTRVEALNMGNLNTAEIIIKKLDDLGVSIDDGRRMVYIKDGDTIPFEELPQPSVKAANGTITVVGSGYFIVNDNVFAPRKLLDQCQPAVGQEVRMEVLPNLGLTEIRDLHKYPWKAVRAHLCRR